MIMWYADWLEYHVWIERNIRDVFERNSKIGEFLKFNDQAVML